MIPESHPLAQELLNPDWPLVERHFGCLMPPALKEFYADPTKILQSRFDLDAPKYGRIHVWSFSTIDHRTIEFFEGYERFIDLASNGGEGSYFFDPKEPNPHVYMYDTGDNKLYPMGLTLSNFLGAPRLPHDEDY